MGPRGRISACKLVLDNVIEDHIKSGKIRVAEVDSNVIRDKRRAKRMHLRKPRSGGGSESKRNVVLGCHDCNRFQGRMRLEQVRRLIEQASSLLERMRKNHWKTFGGN